MLDLNPWSNIPKFNNSKYIAFNEDKNIFQNSSTTFLPRGLGRSYGDVCLNENGYLVLMKDFKNVLEFDYVNGYINCQSGISINEILEIIVPRGWFLPVVPGTSYVTLGGAIANDIHGKNHHHIGSFGNFIESLELLNSKNEILICSEKTNTNLFHATIGGLGLTGIIKSARVKLININNSYINSKTERYKSLEQFFEINEKELNNEYTVSWVDIGLNSDFRGVFHSGNHNLDRLHSKKNKNIKLTFPATPPVSLVNNISLNILNNFYYAINKNSNKKLQSYKSFFFPLDVINKWNKAYGRKGFYQYQFLIPIEDSLKGIKKIIKTIKSYDQRPCLGVLKTFGSIESKGLISFPQKGITLALDFQNKGIKTLNMFNQLDEIVFDYGGRLYPAKDSRMSKESFQKSFENFDNFSEFIDPKFESTFFKRVTV